MKIVFICFYEAYPPVSGAASVSWNMAKHVDGKTTLIQMGIQDGDLCIQNDINIITLQGFVDNRIKKILRIPGWIFKIIGHLNRIEPDIVVLEGASWVLYHWLLMKVIHLLAKPAELIYHSHNVEYNLRKEKHNRFVTEVTRWAEGRILHEVNTATAVSHVDRRQFEYLYGIKPQILPNGVDIDTFDQVSPTQIQTEKKKYALTNQTVLFVGSYWYKPNQNGIDFLIKKVMPNVVERQPDARLAIVGGEVPWKKPWLITPGCIPFQQLPVFVKACTIGVAPIFSGSGTRLKILEYMAAGKPVISTAKGVEGINVKDSVDVLVANEQVEFVEAICKLLNDRILLESIGEKGRKIIGKYYSWQKILKDFPRIRPTLH